MRAEVALAAVLLAACTVPPLDATGKTCTAGCPAPHHCQAGICVAEGGRLCAAWLEPKHACFDFEGSTTVDAQTEITGGRLDVDTSARRFGANSLAASLAGGTGLAVARLAVSLPVDWKRVTAAFDVRPDLPAAFSGGISLGEVLCAGGSYTGLWLFFEGNPPRFVARTDPSTAGDVRPAPELRAWSRVELQVDRTTARGTVRVGGAEAASVPVTDCGGTWTVEIGMSGHAAASATYDDVLVRVERE